ncbi:MAG: DUF1640 domain-containing protein [Magnetococcales bacterium]|nr:DUF1640 domain-containing protein [Magnetococcales bacterium]MBF0114959.1 DUF1640 domain-containing protein [Magnetococcales bacterium]
MSLATESGKTEYAHTGVFDTYSYVRRLRDAGMDENLAAIQAEQFLAVIENRMASKRDVLETEARLTKDAQETEARLTRDLQEIEARLTKDLKEIEARLTKDLQETEARLKLDIAAIDAKLEATKAELKRDLAAIDAKVEATKTELKRDIAVIEAKIESSKADTIKWTAGMFAAQTALILGAMFAIMRMNQPPPVVYHPPAQEMRLPTPAPAAPLNR